MLNPSRKHTSTEINQLTKAVNQDKNAYNWLKNNRCSELAALSDVLVHNSLSALNWLRHYKYNTILLFIDALENDQSAFKSLMDNYAREWAATISVVNDSVKAQKWLLQYQMKHYVHLAMAIKELIDTDDSDYYDSFGSFTGGGGFGSSGGFGGFGGGSFSGGGSGGSW
jgi:uncharacterized membrane protein YgcG